MPAPQFRNHTGILVLLTFSPTLNFSSSWVFPPAATQFSSEHCYFRYAIFLSVSLSLPPFPTPTINSALPLPLSWPGPVCWPCLAFYVFCSGPFQTLLAVLSHMYSKTSPAALAWGSYVISLHKGMVEDPELWIRA